MSNEGTIKRKSASRDLTKGNIFTSLLLFSLPIILMNELQMLFNAADTIVIGQFAGSDSLAAVGSNSSLINLILNLFLGFSAGTNIVVARFIGGKNYERANAVARTAISLALIFGIVIGVFGFLFSAQLLRLTQVEENVIDKASLYLKIYFIGTPANLVYNFGANILRADGDSRTPLIYITIAGVLNVALNLLLVIVFCMDVADVAVATIISQYVSALLIVIHLYRQKGYCHVSLLKLCIHKSEFLAILQVGLPSGINSMMFSLSNVILQSTVNAMGSDVMAGSAAASSIESFVYTAMNGFHLGSQSFVSQNFGAKDFERVKKTVLISVAIVFGIGILLAALALLIRVQLVYIYIPENANAAGFAYERLFAILPMYFLCGIMEIFTGSLRGIGYSTLTMVVSLIGVCGFRILWTMVIFPVYPSLLFLYISMPISWVMTASGEAILFSVFYKRLKKKHAAEILAQTSSIA